MSIKLKQMQINLLQEIVSWETQYKAHVSVQQKADTISHDVHLSLICCFKTEKKKR